MSVYKVGVGVVKHRGRLRWPVAVITLLAIVGTVTLTHGIGQAATVDTLQAESMQLSGTGTSIVADSSASGGSAVKFTSTGGKLTGNIQLPGSTQTITLIAKASNCNSNGWPQVKITVDGVVALPKTTVNGTTWTSYSAPVNLTAASHSVVVNYPSTTTSCQPILYVDAIIFSVPTPAPTVSLQASPTTVDPGQPSTLTWSSTNASSCTANGSWTGSQPTTGTYTTGALNADSTYTLSCTGDGGTASASTTVRLSTDPVLWLPTADKPLGFHWVLGNAIDVNDPVQMGLRDFNGATLPAPDVYDIDGEYNTAATVSYLHNQGKKAICYIDAGAYETYRSDAYKFQALTPQIWGNADQGWAGSYWLDIRRVDELAPIMQARMQMCKDKGFDAIEPDEITGWSNNPGFPITYNDQLVYNRAVAAWAHNIGLSIGLKGDLEQAHDLVNDFDWTLNEQCYQYNECTNIYNTGGPGADGLPYPGLQLFVQQNKAVWVAEYKSYTSAQWTSICSDSQANHFNTSEFKLGLPNNGGRMPCIRTAATSW